MYPDFFVMLNRTSWVGPSAHVLDDSGLLLMYGRPVSVPKQKLRYELRVEPDAPTDQLTPPPCDLHDAGHGQLLMSPRLIAILREVGVDNIQYLDCEVTYQPTGQRIPYKVANVLGVVKALKLDECECVLDEDGFVESFSSMKIDAERVGHLMLFRLFENMMLTIVTRQLKEAVELAGLTGLKFVSESDWDPTEI